MPKKRRVMITGARRYTQTSEAITRRNSNGQITSRRRRIVRVGVGRIVIWHFPQSLKDYVKDRKKERALLSRVVRMDLVKRQRYNLKFGQWKCAQQRKRREEEGVADFHSHLVVDVGKTAAMRAQAEGWRLVGLDVMEVRA